jgi:non-reducing end alpha-L-arabinofuranosidase
VGTGISFIPPTKFTHASGDAVQALGGGITLDGALAKSHAQGAAVVNFLATTVGYQGPPSPNLSFGNPISTSAGSIALLDRSGKVIIDAMIYGSRQSSSSANGTIASPELAVLEGDQSQGGCIVVAPSAGRGGFGRRGGTAAGAPSRSMALSSDGADTDNNCTDFQLQSPTPGASNR